METTTTLNHVSAGCAYEAEATDIEDPYFYSMYGRVSDLQIFGSVLTDDDMRKITGCEDRSTGDILNWDTTKWETSGVSQDIRKESLDWKDIICKPQEDRSYHLIPQRISFEPKSLDVC